MGIPAAGQIEIFKWLKYGEKVLSSKGGPTVTRLYFKCSHGVNTEKGRAGFLCPARKIVDVRTEEVTASNATASPDNRGSCAEPSTASPSSSTSTSSGGEAPSNSSHAHTTTTFRHSHNHQTLASSWVSPRRGMAATTARCRTPTTSTSAANAASNGSASAGATQLHPTSGAAAPLVGQKRRWSSLASTCDGSVIAATAAPSPVICSAAACKSQSQTPVVASVGAASTVAADKTPTTLPIRPVAIRCVTSPVKASNAPISMGSRGAFTAVNGRALTNVAHGLPSAVTMRAPMKRASTSSESISQNETAGSSATTLVSASLCHPAASALTRSGSSKMMSSPLATMVPQSSSAAASLLQQTSVPVDASEALRLSRSSSQSSAVTTQCVPLAAGGGAAFANSGWTAVPGISSPRAAATLRAAPATAPASHGPLASSAPGGDSPIESTLAEWHPCVKSNAAMGAADAVQITESGLQASKVSPRKAIGLGLTEHLRRFQSGSVEELSALHGVLGADQDGPSLGLEDTSTLKSAPLVDLELRLSLG